MDSAMRERPSILDLRMFLSRETLHFSLQRPVPLLQLPRGPGTGSSVRAPLQFTPGTGFTPGTTIIGGNGINFGSGITPGVGLSSNGIAQSSGYNPGASISPAATGTRTRTGFGVTC